MLAYAGGPQRLRPHVKTHKMPAVVRIKLDAGIDKFKCSTIAEAEMVACAGGRDILLAFPQVGPNAARFAAWPRRFRRSAFRPWPTMPTWCAALRRNGSRRRTNRSLAGSRQRHASLGH